MSFPATPPEDAPPDEATRDSKDVLAAPAGDVSAEISLLQAVLPPLLDDFQHWFSRSTDLLETQTIDFLSTDQRQALRSRIQSAQKQVSAAQALAAATEGKAGIDMPVVMSWHSLVHECWGIALRLRRENPGDTQPNHL